jgi:DNA invertase Pin-like site-specific DNA recombinase
MRLKSKVALITGGYGGMRLSERTIAGQQRAKAQGRIGGRPKAEDTEPKLVAKLGRLRSEGRSIRRIAGEVGKSPNTILRLLKSEYATV